MVDQPNKQYEPGDSVSFKYGNQELNGTIKSATPEGSFVVGFNDPFSGYEYTTDTFDAGDFI